MVRGLIADGVTVLLTTQYLEEADQLANDIIVIDHGKVIAAGTPDELKAKAGGQVLQVSPADLARLAEVAALLAARIRSRGRDRRRGRRGDRPVADAALVPHLVPRVRCRGIELAELSFARPAWTRSSSPSPVTARTTRRTAAANWKEQPLTMILAPTAIPEPARRLSPLGGLGTHSRSPGAAC